MKPLSYIFIIIIFCCIACNQKNSSNTIHQKADTSFIVPLAPKDEKPIVLNRPPKDSDVDSFMTCRTRESLKNLVLRHGEADTMNELLFYAIVAADKFKIPHAYYHIAGCLSNYFSYISVGNHSKEIAIFFLKRGVTKNDESCLETYESLDKHTEKEVRKLWIPEKNKANPIVAYKANSLHGNIEDYNKLKKHLIENNKPEELLYYSYIMADRFDYEPARKDIVDVIEKGYDKYKLGKLGKDAKYFCSFFQDQ